jgi:hypothetical protein
MKSLKSKLATAACIMSLSLASASHAFFIDFENGTEGARVNDISGVSFLNYGGYAPMYGDSRVGYNTSTPALPNKTGSYHHEGFFFMWAGTEANAQGVKIDFTNNDGTWFQTGYSSYHNFYINAYLTDGSMITSSGSSNTDSPMDYLRVDATAGQFIDYVVLHDSGNYWLVDNLSGDTSGVNPAVPEPSTLLLLGGGLLGLGFARKRFAKK